MTAKELIDHYRTPTEAARAIGCTPQCIHQWKRRGIPRGMQYLIKDLTGGRLQPDPPAPR